MKTLYVISIFIVITPKGFEASAQQDISNILGQTNGYIPTAVPFLLIAPDARSNGMGNAGAATTPDINSLHWNPAKLAFVNSDFGVAVSYLPWLRQLLNDINYSNFSAFVKIDSMQKIGCSFKYLSLGQIDYGIAGISYGSSNPVEYSIDLAYSRKLSMKTSGAISIRYIYSEASGANVFYYPRPESIKTVACDLSFYHYSPVNFFSIPSQISYGIALTNIGPVNNNVNDSSGFLPTNLRIGTSFKIPFNEKHSVEISLDANKLTVPANHQPGIKSWSNGFFNSFTDAGSFNEEVHEVNFSTGMEYWYDQSIAIRTGYFHEYPEKGNRQFLTLGLGIKYKSVCFDIAYLMPSHQRNPLENTIASSLSFYF